MFEVINFPMSSICYQLIISTDGCDIMKCTWVFLFTTSSTLDSPYLLFHRPQDDRKSQVTATHLYNQVRNWRQRMEEGDKQAYESYMRSLPQYQRVSARDFEVLFYPDKYSESDGRLINYHLTEAYVTPPISSSTPPPLSLSPSLPPPSPPSLSLIQYFVLQCN